MNKKGVSEVVVGLFLILMAFVSVAIVSTVISNIIQTKSEEVSLEGFFVDLNLQSAQLQNDGSVSLKVKRDQGNGEMTGIKFVFSDGENSKVIEKKANLGEFEENTYVFTQDELNGLDAKTVSVAPVIGQVSGREETKSIVETEKIFEPANNENIIVINFATISQEENQEKVPKAQPAS